MKSRGILILIALNAGLLSAGEVKLVRTFETWNAGIIKSTDPAGIVYHPPSGHLFITDSEIDEIGAIWNCENVFEVNLAGDQVFNTFDSYVNNGLSCDDATPASLTRDREPTGITYNEFDGFFYIINDDRTRIMRYNAGFGEAIAAKFVQGTDLEGITSDPSTGFLYVVAGEGMNKVIVFNSVLDSLSEFSVDDRVGDPEGIAYNQQLNHLFLVSQSDLKIFEYTLTGEFVTDYDISSLDSTPIDPQGLTFAPSSDPNDDPGNINVYIADGQVDNSPDPDKDRDGIIYEAEIFPFDFLANKKFKMNDKHGNSQGNVHSNDKIEIKKGLPSTHTGNLTAVKDIKIEEKNTINGDVTAGGKLEIKSKATVNGTATGKAAVAKVRLPVVSFKAGKGRIKVRDKKTLTLAPGRYEKLEVGKRATLFMSSGEYYFKKVVIEDDAVLSVDVAKGLVSLNVVDEFQFRKRARVEITPLGESGSRFFTLRQVKDNDIILEKETQFLGSIIAPKAKKVKIEDDAQFKGLIIAKEIEVKENATLVSHSSSLGSLAKTLAAKSAPQTVSQTTETQPHSIPSGFSLSQNYPNPFNPETQIRFQLPEVTHVVLRIYNVRGQEIRRLLDRPFEAGNHSVRWHSKDNHGNRVSSGVYFYQLQADSFSQVKKMILLQ